ncbi:MAG: tetratricopeptide repeat protein [Brevinema sp.]
MNNIISKGLAKDQQARALDAFYHGNYKQASDLWREIYQKDSQDVIAVKGLAYCAMVEESYREALDFLEDVKLIATMDPEIHSFIALLHLKMGKIAQATDTILNALEIIPKDSLLLKTLEKIRKTSDPEFAKSVPIVSLVQLTMPVSASSFFHQKRIIVPIILAVSMIITMLLYKPVGHFVRDLFTLEPAKSTPISDIEIKDLKQIVDAREKFQIVLSEKVIEKKFIELKQAINNNQVNKARILANELLASNASLAVKDRVSILEAFIPEANPDNLDYVPSYAEIASAPLLYRGILIKWNGKTTNIHKGKDLLTFDLLINSLDAKRVEGIAAVEVDNNTIRSNYYDRERVDTYNNKITYFNNENVTITGYFEGITSDNRVIIKTTQLEVFRKDGDPKFSTK